MLQRTDQSERQRLAKARAAARKRRYHARLASGGAVLAVPTRDINKLIDALVMLRWLDISVSEDRKQIGAAVGALLDDLAERRCSS